MNGATIIDGSITTPTNKDVGPDGQIELSLKTDLQVRLGGELEMNGVNGTKSRPEPLSPSRRQRNSITRRLSDPALSKRQLDIVIQNDGVQGNGKVEENVSKNEARVGGRVQEVDLDECALDEEEEEVFDADNQSKKNYCSYCLSTYFPFIYSHLYSTVMALLGLVFIFSGLLMLVYNQNVLYVPEAFILTGEFLFSHIIGTAIYAIFRLCFKLALRCSTRKRTKYWLNLIIYYIDGCKNMFPLLFWFIVAICMFKITYAALINYSSSTISTWPSAFDQVIKAFGVVSLILLCFVLARMTQMHLVQDFGTRSYRGRMNETMRNQNFLLSLGGTKDRHPVFATLADTLLSVGSNEIIPTVWQQLITYVTTHHVNGAAPRTGRHVPPVNGLEEDLSKVAKAASQKLYRRLFFLCEADKVVTRHRENEREEVMNKEGIKRTLSDSRMRKIQEQNEESVSSTVANDDASSQSSVSSRQMPFPKLLATKSRSQTDRRKIHKANFMSVMHELRDLSDTSLDLEELWKKELDPNDTGLLNFHRFARIIQNMFEDRYSLSISLQDARHVIKSMERLILSMYLVVAFLLILIIYQVDVAASLTAIFGAVVAWSFVFGNSARESFEGLIFCFGIHLYDVGDLIDLGGEKYKVIRIHLLTTDMKNTQGGFVRLENSKIRSMGIIQNLSTSDSFGSSLRFHVAAYQLSTQFMTKLDSHLQSYVHSRPDDFESVTISAREFVHPVVTGAMIQGQHVMINIWVTYARSDENFGANFQARSKILIQIVEFLKQNGFALPPIQDATANRTFSPDEIMDNNKKSVEFQTTK